MKIDNKHRGKIIGGLLGLFFGISAITVGFVKTVVLFIFVVVGLGIGIIFDDFVKPDDKLDI